MKKQPYSIRPHHGLCLGFFRGMGYSGAFAENMAAVKAAMDENPLVCLVGGADDICAACPNNVSGRCESGEKPGRYDQEVLRRCGLSVGEVLPYQTLEERVRRDILVPGQREEICGDCQWSALCHFAGEEI